MVYYDLSIPKFVEKSATLLLSILVCWSVLIKSEYILCYYSILLVIIMLCVPLSLIASDFKYPKYNDPELCNRDKKCSICLESVLNKLILKCAHGHNAHSECVYNLSHDGVYCKRCNTAMQ